MSTGLLVADFEIRQLHARFVDAVWRQDADGFAALWSRDGVWKIAGMEMTGRDAIAEGCRGLLGRCERIRLIPTDAILNLDAADDDRATGRLYVTEMTRLNAETQVIVFGAYYDRYIREDGAWRFGHRHWDFHYRGAFPIGEYNPITDFGPPPGMPGLDEPTYVRRS